MTFGEELIQFARAVDYVDGRSFDLFRKLVDEYTANTLNIKVTRLMIVSGSPNKPSLTPYGLAKRGRYRYVPIRNGRKYGGHTAIVFDKGKPAWIVSATEKPGELRKAKRFIDKWGSYSSDELPAYQVPTVDPIEIKTSIILPLIDHTGRIFGVFNFETTERLDITKEAQRELSNIANAVAIAYQSNKTTEASLQGITEALGILENHLHYPHPKLTKPNIFLASSLRAPKDVISAVIKVFDEEEFSSKFEVVYWKEMKKPGNINHQLLKRLSRCRYGVCYLSEPCNRCDTSGRVQYRDNPNVVFEAGMLHGRSDAAAMRPASWIPIREKSSMTAPFDFATERTIIIQRRSGSFNVGRFKEDFRMRLRGLLADDEP